MQFALNGAHIDATGSLTQDQNLLLVRMRIPVLIAHHQA